jgi:SAM-dependent methyltransferase
LSGLGAEHFERIYARDADPWKTESSEYERSKFERTLAAIPDGPVPRALDVGCSTGVLSALLADRCDELTAVDFSERAAEATRERLAGLRDVSVERLDLPAEMPTGPFDLVVCSEVLWYWSPAEVLDGLRRIESALAPGGALIAVGWTGDDPEAPMTGPEVNALIAARTVLEHTLHEAEPGAGYVIDRWELAQ